jgi:hypothetical protein
VSGPAAASSSGEAALFRGFLRISKLTLYKIDLFLYYWPALQPTINSRSKIRLAGSANLQKSGENNEDSNFSVMRPDFSLGVGVGTLRYDRGRL